MGSRASRIEPVCARRRLVAVRIVGVRVMGVRCTFRPNGLDEPRPATADFFPAYDDDGGLLLALTPS